MENMPISKPTEGSSGKTGLWRFEKPVIDLGKCTGCLLCIIYCPEASMMLIDSKPSVNYDFCKGCGICSEECPVKAIEMVRE